jgi:hypothetical protein
VVKLLVGLLKGAVVGGAVGYGAYAIQDSFNNPWLTFGLIGALVGLIAGRPIWALLRDKNATNVIAILKAAFGFGVGCGLFAIVSKAWGPTWDIAGVPGGNVFAWYPTLGGAIGAVYGAFVELDDSISDDGKKEKALDGDKSEPRKKLKA